MSSSTLIPRLDSGKLALIQHIDAMLPAAAAVPDLSADDLAEMNTPVRGGGGKIDACPAAGPAEAFHPASGRFGITGPPS